MPSREFDPRGTATEDPDPITFRVAGRVYRCARLLPPKALGLLQAIPPLPDPDDPTFLFVLAQYQEACAAFIRCALVGDDRTSWDDLLLEEAVDASCLAEIVAWLAQIHTERITVPEPEPEPEPPAYLGLPAGYPTDEIAVRQWNLDHPDQPVTPNVDPVLAAVEAAGGGVTLPDG